MKNIYPTSDKIIISIVSTKSGMGKTTLVESLIKKFTQKGYRVGALKHDAHKFEVDKKGKDSYKFAKAGALEVVLASKEKIALIKSLNEEKRIDNIVKLFNDVDIIFTEGFKNNNFPKIEVHRKSVDNKFLFNDEKFEKGTFLALATDENVEGILNLDLNNLEEIVSFIESFIFKNQQLQKENQKNILIDYKYDDVYKKPIIKIEKEHVKYIEEDIIGEYPLSLILNKNYHSTFLCTPRDIKPLIVGFLATKGHIKNKNDIKKIEVNELESIVNVEISNEGHTSLNKEMIFLNPLNYIECEKVENNSVSIEIETIYEIMNKNLNSSKLFKDTGGVHSVSIFNQNKAVITCEDVARHNAMDKAIGHCILEGINLEDKIILVSGRISLEMMLKAAKMQIPVIISKSAPTNLSIELANKLNITLIGFVRGERMNIYTNPQRVLIKV